MIPKPRGELYRPRGRLGLGVKPPGLNLNPKPPKHLYALNPGQDGKNLNPKPETLNPKPETLNPKPHRGAQGRSLGFGVLGCRVMVLGVGFIVTGCIRLGVVSDRQEQEERHTAAIQARIRFT